MLSKEECEMALSVLIFKNTNFYGLEKLYPQFKYEFDIIFELLEEHFELVEKYNALLTRFNALENPKPYKFEDLKVGMWVWDRKENKCNKIIEINNDKIEFYYVIDNATRFTCKFEENRFFPVWMANVEVKE